MKGDQPCHFVSPGGYNCCLGFVMNIAERIRRTRDEMFIDPNML